MKMTYALAVVSFLVLALSSITNASLNVDVNVEYPQILQSQNQIVTATTNERGKGVLLVIQPVEGPP